MIKALNIVAQLGVGACLVAAWIRLGEWILRHHEQDRHDQ